MGKDEVSPLVSYHCAFKAHSSAQFRHPSPSNAFDPLFDRLQDRLSGLYHQGVELPWLGSRGVSDGSVGRLAE
jgi:hypothetical protein